jgi:hypothetical protein
MCANGPASRSGSAAGSAAWSTRVLEVLAAQHRHQADTVLVVGHLAEVVHDPGHALAFDGDGGVMPALAPGRLRVTEPLPRRVQEWQVGHRPGVGFAALQLLHLPGAEPGSAQAQVGGYRP